MLSIKKVIIEEQLKSATNGVPLRIFGSIVQLK
jgi:hypothetical protein